MRTEIRDLIDELAFRAASEATAGEGLPGTGGGARAPLDRAERTRAPKVLIVPARDEADEIGGEALAQLLAARGWDVEALSEDTLVSEVAERAAATSHVVVVAALPPGAGTHARSWTRRLRLAAPAVPIVVGLWGGKSTARLRDRLAEAGTDRVGATLAETLSQVRSVASHASRNAPRESPVRTA
ncbi:hypothetical protein LzC2_41210 [Planctomycetes bacterium LzC2]|uniref:Response regulatory domain-containing protein n=1 Tax=Alienimonas chondri TaxID=2681879 RepID=A0ABX1VKV1_9PLAN|nr:hypothetical protein [Alienimonas chondri]